MQITNNTQFNFLNEIVEDALKKCNLKLGDKPIENVEITNFDFENISFTIEGCPFILNTYDVKSVNNNKLNIKYALFMGAGGNCMFTDEIQIIKPEV